MYVLILLMCEYGFRSTGMLKQTTRSNVKIRGIMSTGLLLEDIRSISYSKELDRYKIVFVPTYSKTSDNKADEWEMAH